MSRDIATACESIEMALDAARTAYVEITAAVGSFVAGDSSNETLDAFARASLDMAGALSGIADDVAHIRNAGKGSADGH